MEKVVYRNEEENTELAFLRFISLQKEVAELGICQGNHGGRRWRVTGNRLISIRAHSYFPVIVCGPDYR